MNKHSNVPTFVRALNYIDIRSDYWHWKTGVTRSHRSDITTGSGTNSHGDDIATENSFSMGEHEARLSRGFTLKEGGAQPPKG